ncbi:hypothetical protein L3X38_008589 [Prunus dulcis]|uniref:Uncharacterized protein n=1 Tax=Prunus dulcis TaxID=3755 RepID=A0AAD4ZWU8_PRUDU|nr:hypothetical protein L3X38_008589 [Prunus dulcis]
MMRCTKKRNKTRVQYSRSVPTLRRKKPTRLPEFCNSILLSHARLNQSCSRIGFSYTGIEEEVVEIDKLACGLLNLVLGFTVWWTSCCLEDCSHSQNIQVPGSCLVMVCQAASQTRFRALKHENGIDGSATIIVRVIACFQPLQDCQAEYFRHLLKPVT